MFKITFIVGLFLLFGIVGHFEQDDKELELAEYCDNVRSHTWPDYKNIYKKECKPIDAPVKVVRI